MLLLPLLLLLLLLLLLVVVVVVVVVVYALIPKVGLSASLFSPAASPGLRPAHPLNAKPACRGR